MASSELLTVHLVDDDASVRRSVGFMLKTTGHNVHFYESGGELLNARELEQGCILLDVRMRSNASNAASYWPAPSRSWPSNC